MRKNLKLILSFVFFVQAIACLAVAIVLLLKKKYTASAILGALSAAGIFGGTVLLIKGRKEKALAEALDDDYLRFDDDDFVEEDLDSLENEGA